MADGYATATQRGLVALLSADAGLAALLAGGVWDEAPADVALPYLRIARLEVQHDDTDGTEGARVQVGLEVHSRPRAGRVEAQRICEAAGAALHRRPEALTAAPYNVIEIEVQAWSVSRDKDGATYTGTLAAEVRLDA